MSALPTSGYHRGDDDPLTPTEQSQLWSVVMGNGREGLTGWQRRVNRILFKDEDTGERGLVKDVAEIKRLVVGLRALMWGLGVLVAVLEGLRTLGPTLLPLLAR